MAEDEEDRGAGSADSPRASRPLLRLLRRHAARIEAVHDAELDYHGVIDSAPATQGQGKARLRQEDERSVREVDRGGRRVAGESGRCAFAGRGRRHDTGSRLRLDATFESGHSRVRRLPGGAHLRPGIRGGQSRPPSRVTLADASVEHMRLDEVGLAKLVSASPVGDLAGAVADAPETGVPPPPTAAGRDPGARCPPPPQRDLGHRADRLHGVAADGGLAESMTALVAS